MKVGRRLAIKLLNASKFVLGLGVDAVGTAGRPEDVTEPLDRAMLAKLATVVDEATVAFEAYQYQRALDRTDTFFWQFCDDCVELVKTRAYGDDPAARSARAALAMALSALQRLFAPVLPFATEEVWSWWQEGSVHRQPWPTSDDLVAAAGDTDPAVLDVAADVLGEIRKAKSTARRGMRTEVTLLTVADTAERLARFALCERDVREAGNVTKVVTRESAERLIVVELAPPDSPAPSGA